MMKRVFVLLAGLGLAVAGLPALADPPATGVVKDRAAFMPSRNYAALPGKAIGILLDGKYVTALDHWGGPPELLVFSTGGHSYRKVYVPTADNPQVTNFSVPVGTEGKRETYPALCVASPRAVIPWGVTARYSLVEVEVNSGMGSPAQDCFVATNFKVLDGTKDYPLKVADVIANVERRYAERVKANDIEKAMTDAAKQALKDKAPTGPREKNDLMFIAYYPESATLEVRFRTKLSDGAYTIKDNPVVGPKVPPRLPPRLPPQPVPPAPPAPPAPQGGAAGGGGAAVGGGAVAQPAIAIARPVRTKQKTGTMFGIEFGQAYTVNKKGEIIRIDELPIQTFTQQVNQTIFGPGPGPIRPRPVPLPAFPPPPPVQPAPGAANGK